MARRPVIALQLQTGLVQTCLQSGFITIRNTAMSGAHRRDPCPRSSRTATARRIRASFQLPARPARAFANSFFCSGPTAIANARPEMPNSTSDQAIQNVRSSGKSRDAAPAHTPVAMMSSTPGTVNSRSLLMMPSSACARARRSPRAVGMHFPEHAGDDVAEEQHDAHDVQRLQDQVEHV